MPPTLVPPVPYTVPQPVRPGDTVAVASISGPPVAERLEEGLAVLRGWGLHPVALTSVQGALLRHLGWASLHGPMVATWYFAQPSAQEGLRRLLMEPQTVTALDCADGVPVVGGVAEGVLVGGCATLLASSIGTDSCHPAAGAILFVVDVDEDVYELDRAFTQLRRSGYLDGLRGVLAGSFHGCTPERDVLRLVEDRFGDLGVPVLAGADIGHGVPLQTLPLGRAARLDVDARRLELMSVR